jgi:DUF4097 and DUF4098 domain-containing protein YvlB
MPPGGGAPPPFPPYDPKTQWRVYREQQKAAWRAQRDAWKAQRYAWKAGYGGAYGPRVPSIVGPVILIGVGVVALLVVSGHIAANDFWSWYGRWWPLLLILAGLGLLAEWALDLRRETPVRRSGSFVGLIIFLAFLGFASAGWHHMGPWVNNWDNNNNGDFFNSFGMPEHDNDQQVLNSQIPANSSIDIENPRGDVSITAGDGSNVEVQAHEVAFADSDAGAKKIFDAEAAQVKVSGNAVLIKSEGNNTGRVNLTVTVPKTAKVTVNAAKGDVTAAGLGAGINLSSTNGDTHLNSIAGSVLVHFSNGRHDFSAHQIAGDLSADGDCNDFTLSEIKGRVSTRGDIYGEVHVENVTGPLSIHTSRTDVQIAELPGDLTFDSDNLHVNESKGLVRVVTHSKDVDLSQIYGDSYVENRDARISVEPAGPFSVEAKDSKGDVEVTLPPNASGSVNVHTHNGDIVSDYPLPNSPEGENKTAAFTIGSGSSKIVLSSDNGDVRIKKGSAFPAAPPVPGAPDVPAAPAPPNARHLKPPKAPVPPPVTQ